MDVVRSLVGFATTSFVLVFALAGCGRAAISEPFWGSLATRPKDTPVELREISQAGYSRARERLAEARARLPAKPYVERVRVSMIEPHTRMRYEARGAVAVDPDRAVRMLLLGPSGTTAIDLWVTRDRYRFSVPALSIEKRGSTTSREARDLPVGFFRWWFLSPLRGRLLAGDASEFESAWLLRDGSATILMRVEPDRFFALRREGDVVAGIAWRGHSLAPEAGSTGHYREGRYGLQVDVEIEAIEENAPPKEAFDDPDAVGGAP